MLILIVAGGPDKGRIYELHDGSEVVLGRDGDQVQLNDTKVSRKHARLWSEGGRWYLEDLDSKHGTFRNHKQVEHGVKQPLKDGDYLQIGSTVLVVARMPTMLAERQALLGDVPEPRGVSKRTLQLAGGALAAAVAIVGGLNVWTMMDNREQARLVAEQIEAATRDPARQQFEDEVREKLAATVENSQQAAATLTTLAPTQEALRRDLAQRLDAVTAAVEQDPTAPLSDKIEAVLLAIKEQGGRDAAMSERLLATLRDAPAADDVAAAVAARMSPLSPQQVERLASAAEALTQTGSLAKLDKLDTLDQALANVRGAVNDQFAALGGRLDETTGRLDQALTRLDQTPTREDLTRSLALASDAQATRLSTLAEQLAQRQTTTGGAPDLSSVEQRLDTLARSIDALAAQPGVTGEAASALAESTSVLREQVADLAEQVRDRSALQQLEQRVAAADQRLAGLDGAIDKLDELPAVRDEIRRLAEAAPAPATADPKLAETLGKLTQAVEQRSGDVGTIRTELAALTEELRRRTDPSTMSTLVSKLTSLDSLLARDRPQDQAVVEVFTQMRQELADIRRSLGEQPDAAAIERQLASVVEELKNRPDAAMLREQLEALAARQPVAADPVLEQVLAAVTARARKDAELDALIEQFKREPYVNRAMLDEALAALPREAAPAINQDQLVAGLSEKLAGRFQPAGNLDAEELRRAIRAEVVASLTNNADVLAAAIAKHGVLQTPSPGDDGRALSRTEQAYKLAFETGRPVTVGAGLIDPSTNEPSNGRVLDPRAARDAGMTTWREWYLYDDASERMRMAREASRIRGGLGDPSIIALPAAAPEPATEQN